MTTFLRKALADWRVRLVASVLLSALLMVLMSLQGRFGVTDDDWAISVALSGRYPDSGLCLFVNALVSKLVLFLSSLCAQLNWFLLLEGVLAFVAFAAFCYALLTFITPILALLMIAGTEYFFMPYCTYFGNFTFVAALSTLAGMALLIGWVSRGGQGRMLAAFGVGLGFCGFCIRQDAFLLSLPFFAIGAFVPLWEQRREVGAFKLLTPFFVLVALCVAAYAFDAVAWSAPGWSEWREFNGYRAQISDYRMPAYADVEQRMLAAGIDEDAYFLATNWCTGNVDFFTMDRMRALASVSLRWDMGNVLAAFIEYPLAFPGHARILLFSLGIIALSLFLARKGRRWSILAALAVAYLCCVFFFGIGRLIDRVEVPACFYAMLCAVFAVGRSFSMPAFAIERLKLETVSRACACVGLAVVVFLTAHMANHLLRNFDPSVLPELVDQTDHVPDYELYDVAMEGQEVYLWDTLSYVVLEATYEHRFLPAEDFLLKNICMGGWTSDAPFIIARDEEAGVADPVDALVNGEKIQFVSYMDFYADHLLGFIQTNYYPDAQMREVKRFRDPVTKETFTFYEFYRAGGA